MSFSIRYLPAILVAVLSIVGPLCAQSATKQAVKVPRGSVSGRVTIKDKGAPGVAVGLRKGESYNPNEPYLKATTDQDGFYRISELAAGTYSITVAAPGYVMVDMRDLNRTKTLLMGEDENVENINFALVRGGVITGRVTDADGRPVIEQTVTVFPAEIADRRQQAPYPGLAGQTDDRGVYRIFGLNAGRYKVACGRANEEQMISYTPDRALSYRQVFHPDVSDYAKATVIEVSEGSEATNVDISLGRALQSFTATGQIIQGETPITLQTVRLGLQQNVGKQVKFLNTFPVVNSKGEFIVQGLFPGTYSLYLFANQGGMRGEPVSFEIIDHDVSGIVMRLTKGASISGVVVLEREDKSAWEKLLQLQLRAFVPQASGGGGSSASGAIAPDGSFLLAGLPGGPVNMVLGSTTNPMPPKGFNVVRIERDGAASRLEIKDGEQVLGVRVIVAYGTATLRGAFRFENGSLPPGARMNVRLTKARTALPFRPPIVDERGHFLMEGIPAGTYELQGMIFGPSMPGRNVRQEVTVQDGEVKDVIITVDLSAPVKPGGPD